MNEVWAVTTKWAFGAIINGYQELVTVIEYKLKENTGWLVKFCKDICGEEIPFAEAFPHLSETCPKNNLSEQFD